MSGHAERASVAPRERERIDWPVARVLVASVIAAYAVFAAAIYVAITVLFP